MLDPVVDMPRALSHPLAMLSQIESPGWSTARATGDSC